MSSPSGCDVLYAPRWDEVSIGAQRYQLKFTSISPFQNRLLYRVRYWRQTVIESNMHVPPDVILLQIKATLCQTKFVWKRNICQLLTHQSWCPRAPPS